MLRIAGGGMNIEAYDAEALRKIVRLLEYENRLLKDKLKKENIRMMNIMMRCLILDQDRIS